MSHTEHFTRRLSWYQGFTPSTITVHSVKTGAQIQEPSLVALELNSAPPRKQPFCIGEEFNPPLPAFNRCLAVGRGALDCRNAPDVAVYSPLRGGQIADYDAARYLFRELFRRVRPKSPVSAVFKPIMCIHVQEYTTEVEERALIDAGIQTGARQVLLYREPFPPCWTGPGMTQSFATDISCISNPRISEVTQYVPAHHPN